MNAPAGLLLTFEEAARKLNSAVTVASLHAARRRGELWAKKIGQRYFTSWPAVMEYLACPDPESPPASITGPMNSNGSSGTAPPSDGQAMAMASIERLKRHSLNTSSPKSHPRAEVRRMPGI